MSARGAGGDRRWRKLFRLPEGRRQAAVDVAREIQHHLDLCTNDLITAGLSPDAARAESRRRFGDPEGTAAECRTIEGERQEHVRRREWLQGVRQDIGYALRTLRRAPGFTIAAVLTLGLGIGATTAMFSVVDAVLLRPLPFPGSERVVALVPYSAGVEQRGSPALLAAWGEQSRSLELIAAMTERFATILDGGGAERIGGAAVSGRFFDVLALRPALGRPLGPADDQPGRPAVVVLSHALWTRTYGADPGIVGRTVRFDGAGHTVIGVMPARLDGAIGAMDFWVPLALPISQRENFTPYLTLVGRLVPGIEATVAARELEDLTVRLGARAAKDGVFPTISAPRLHQQLADDYSRPLRLMLTAVGVVLLIGCANVAILVLARSVGRARELAVRASLGAGQGRLVRQLAVEHLVIGALAAGCGILVAALCTRALISTIPMEIPRLADAQLDLRALVVAATLGVVTSLLCGVAPLLHQRRLPIRALLQGGTRGSTDHRGDQWRRMLVGAEVALVVVLLTGAGLLIRTATALGRVDPGFDVGGVLTARLALPQRDYPELNRTVLAYDAMLAAVRSQPGITSAALVSRVPLGGSATSIDVALADVPFSRLSAVNAALRITSPDYFRSIGVPLLAGRDLRQTDDAGAASVVVVNASLARHLGGETAVIGRRIRSDNSAFAVNGVPREMEIVGVVGDVLDGGLRVAAQPEFYAPLGQVDEEPWNYWIGREMLLVARAGGDQAQLAAALRRAVASVDPRVPLYDVRTTGERLSRSLAVERFTTYLLALLGALGLGLAALGINGVVAYSATQRTREIGVRLALGATASQAIGLIVRQGMRPVIIGLVVGLGAAALMARAVAGMFFGVSPLDPVSLFWAASLLTGVSLLACYGPARRIARVEPASALRSE